MIMKTVAHFKPLHQAKNYALDNTKTKQIMIIQFKEGRYYVLKAETDKDISLITDYLMDYMRDNNCYIIGFTYYFNGWNDECKLYIDINH